MALPFPCVFEQAEKNVYLEERLQVLQQQNEDLKERIDKNVAVSRSEEIAAHHCAEYMYKIYYYSICVYIYKHIYVCDI